MLPGPKRAPHGGQSRLFEDVLGKKVQVVAPFGTIVGIPIHVPDVGHALLFKVVVNALADEDQAVPVAATKPKQLQLFWNRRIGHDVGRGPGVRGRGEPADVGKRVDVSQSDVQALAASHRQTGQGPMVAVRNHGIVRL